MRRSGGYVGNGWPGGAGRRGRRSGVRRDAQYPVVSGSYTERLSVGFAQRRREAGQEQQPETDPAMIDALPETIEPPLLMVDPDVAYRGGTGTCLGGASLERTTNGGKAWRPLTVPAEAILDLRTTGTDSVEVVGADERCRVRIWASADQGETWSEPTSASGIFVRLPDTTREIATPSGVVRRTPAQTATSRRWRLKKSLRPKAWSSAPTVKW